MQNDGRTAFGKNIRNRRQELEISQERLAEQAGLHRTYVGGIERGERNVSLDNILCIAKALNITASDLMRGVV
ncbi:helix-turn-helix domain-containing protein [Rhizobium metallidurans]|uniref:Transcriptional regulator with XRE-family HTH domain n=1 Tax=Rhizobium metallidurans TaxID=1265931 RepID=A0A7W6CME2_9HYPH|nr:helix-turn-helix transcriptional regulator [Rhizobium metallidurans]MBB3963690.1 transcriptional regulator with XRE-family HTH domain [Rhizobium metallidurans]